MEALDTLNRGYGHNTVASPLPEPMESRGRRECMPFCYTTSLSAVPVAQRVKEQAKEIRKAIRHLQQGMP